ncbi:hypothetical protein BKH43_04655 [Helicobacter sp. 13S00401-1]|uniref:hypothetical protein n=1 Tax=Helicobacter sp. 13S00401-1 TaxID=1905758 RepID=UPI000BA4F595|nr:hypothetical protein [Helicobacter sp. 13S00401-1]PAF50385.1 hypothetical protein BKH43_04655 [Helicobacter sp. 13S00401-1]
MKPLKKITLAVLGISLLSTSFLSAKDSTRMSNLVSIEFGTGIGFDFRRDFSPNTFFISGNVRPIDANFNSYSTRLTPGIYIRPWIGTIVRFAPFIKFDYSFGLINYQQRDSIVQAQTTINGGTTTTTVTEKRVNNHVNYNPNSSNYVPNNKGVLAGTADYPNIMSGALLGFQIPVINATVFAGASYSTFFNTNVSNTWAINYGFKINVDYGYNSKNEKRDRYGLRRSPVVGIEGSYQQPYVQSVGAKVPLNRIQLILGMEY